MRAKHIPQRTCVSCRTTDAKRTLVRLVRTGRGRVEVDSTGKANGRGAYLCARKSCWDDSIKRGRLASALRTTIAPDNAEELRTSAERFATESVATAVS